MPPRPRKATAAVQKPDFAALLAGARLPQRTVQICLRADLVADHEEAEAQLSDLVRRPTRKFGGDGAGELRQRILDLEAEMKASVQPFRVQGMSGPKFRALKLEHPPRKAEDGSGIEPRDQRLGINVDTFWEPLVRASVVDPDITDEQWVALFEVLTDRQFDQLATAAWNLNKDEIDVPFSLAASLMTETSDSE